MKKEKLCPFCGRVVSSPRARICGSEECKKKQIKLGVRSAMVMPAGYVTTAAYARLHNLTVQAVNQRCRKGLIAGVIQDKYSGRWFIPDAAAKEIGEDDLAQGRRVMKHRLKATREEFDEIVARAESAGMSVNEYLISCALR